MSFFIIPPEAENVTDKGVVGEEIPLWIVGKQQRSDLLHAYKIIAIYNHQFHFTRILR